MLPSVASWTAPNVIAHDPVPLDESVQRPARLIGGVTGAPPGGVAPAAGLAGTPLSTARRSLPLQAASSALQIRSGRLAMRRVMKADCGPGLKQCRLWLAEC